MSFRLKDNNIPSEFKANYLKPTSFSKLKFGSSSVTPLKNTEEEAVSYNLPADDSSASGSNSISPAEPLLAVI